MTNTLEQLKSQDPEVKRIRANAVTLIKAATLGLIGDGERSISTDYLQDRMKDQADRLGCNMPAWPVIVDALQEDLGWEIINMKTGFNTIRLPERGDLFRATPGPFTLTREQLIDSIKEQLFHLRVLSHLKDMAPLDELIDLETGAWVDLGTFKIDPSTLGPVAPMFKHIRVKVKAGAYEKPEWGTGASIELEYDYQHYSGSNYSHGLRVRFDCPFKTWTQVN